MVAKLNKHLEEIIARIDRDLEASPQRLLFGFTPTPEYFRLIPDEVPNVVLRVDRNHQPPRTYLNRRFTWDEIKRLPYANDLIRMGLVKDIPSELSGVSVSRRLEVGFSSARKHLPLHLQQQLSQFFSTEAAVVSSGVFGLWAAGHYIGYSWVVDLILAGLAGYATGTDLAEVSDHLWQYFDLSMNAQSAEDLDLAGQHMAQVIAKVGVDAILGYFIGKAYGAAMNSGLAGRLDAAGRLTLPWRTIHIQPGKPLPLLTGGRVPAAWEISLMSRKTGLSQDALRQLMRTAQGGGVRIQVRIPGVARGQIDTTHPKPEWLKMNTVNSDDVHLGMKMQDHGKVAIFRPKAPDPNLQRTNPKLYDQIMRRYHDRMKQLESYGAEVLEMVNRGEILLMDGIIHNPRTGLPYSGDNDLHSIMTPGGKMLGSDDFHYNRVLRELMRGPFNAQHGALGAWKPSTPMEKLIFNKLMEQHRTSEPVLQAREDGSIWLTLAE